VQGVAQESHEEATGGERFGCGVDEVRLQHVLFAQHLQPGEIGSLQVLDQRMVGGEAARRVFRLSPSN
jgi:hypothetical protein